MKDSSKKLSTKIWRPVVDKLNRKLNQACLRRDAYLSRVLEVELPSLEEEVQIPNSKDGRKFISECLELLDRKLVSLNLRSDLVEQLDSICERRNIVRDAFFNRLFFFLALSPEGIDRVFFPYWDEWRTEVWVERRNDSPAFSNLFYPLKPTIDPFWAIRVGLEEADLAEGGDGSETEGIYTVVLREHQFKDVDLSGLNCYLPDEQIPGHPAFGKTLDELLATSAE